ncbi:MAG: hypothetical protein GKC05_03955 [Methanomicrobiales archaeon]|nr:hypothetical protein [Methanomicrobiales archaeon]
MRRLILLSIILVVMVAVIGPVSAYDIKVNPITTGPIVTDSLLSRLSSYQSSTQSDILNLIQSGSITYTGTGSQGSVSAYSNAFAQDQTTLLRFSESVTASGIINNFRYSAHFDSGFFC